MNPDSLRGIPRRRFLKTGAAGGLWLAAGGLSWGCADEGLNPDNVTLLWVAQSVEGVVREIPPSNEPIEGASVRFIISFKNVDFNRGQTTTGSDGSYRFSAARNGAPDAYWVLQPLPEDLDMRIDFPVDLKIQVGKAGYLGREIEVRFVRRAMSEQPRGNLAPYNPTFNVLLTPGKA